MSQPKKNVGSPMTEWSRSAARILADLYLALMRGVTRSQKKKLHACLREVVKGTELKVDPLPSKRIFFEMKAHGTINGIPVTLTLVPPGVNVATITLMAEGLPKNLELWAQGGVFWVDSSSDECLGLFWRDPAAVRNTDIRTGSGTFDEMVEIRGHVALCLALLDEKTRGLIAQVVRNQDAILRDRRLVMRMQGLYLDATPLIAWVAPFLELVRALSSRMKKGTKACLIENYSREAWAPVRALNLAALGLAFPGEPETLEVSRNALQDKSLWCRIYGAANLDSEGKALLFDTLRDIRNHTFQRATALYHLGRILPAEEAERLLMEHLDSREWPVLLAAAQGLAEGARTASAVPVLHRLARTATNREVRDESSSAAEKIQARLEGAEAGQLSVAVEGNEGRLSRTEDGS